MNILTINTSHDGAITIACDNELIVHQQIDRYSQIKNTTFPNLKIIEKIKELNINFDLIHFQSLQDSYTNVWVNAFRKYKVFEGQNLKIKIDDQFGEHHLYHAMSSIYFNKNIDNEYDIFISDGNGATKYFNELPNNECRERISFYTFNKKLYNNFKYYAATLSNEFISQDKNISSRNIGVGEAYGFFTKEFGYSFNEEGKLMALSSYGKFNKDLFNELIYKDNFNLNTVFWNNQLNQDYKMYKNLNSLKDNIYAQDIAFNFQKVCEEITLKLIQKHSKTDTVCIGGGVMQNVLINTYLSKSLNKKIIVDPIGNDQGISLGAMVFNTENKLQKVDTLYLGFKPKYNLNIFEEESFKILDCNAKDVSKILLEEPVAIFQGRSEQGQRGLGNRSLLMNPIHNKCIEKINSIKKREWFRPFSCSILHEELNNWFIVDNDRNPFFMMFVFNAKENVKEKINNVLAKDGTCRLQSVTSKHNQNYHALLKEFFYLTKVPILLNTSLNLPGHPLVETVEDLKYTMLNSNLKYSYLPDINKLIIKNE